MVDAGKTVSAAISEKYHQRQPVRREASVCHARPGSVVRHRAINALARFSGGTDMFFPRCMMGLAA